MGVLHSVVARWFLSAPGFIDKEPLLVERYQRVVGLCQFGMGQRVGEHSKEGFAGRLRLKPLQSVAMNEVGRIGCALVIVVTKHGIGDILV